jgi:hypothetical protein
MRERFSERLDSTYSWPELGFEAYLRYFREGSAGERLDFNSIRSFFRRCTVHFNAACLDAHGAGELLMAA